jgi:hypothetical protein
MLDALERVFFAALLGGLAMAASLLAALLLSTARADTLAGVVMWPVALATLVSHWVGSPPSPSPSVYEGQLWSAGLYGFVLGFFIYSGIAYVLVRKWKRA